MSFGLLSSASSTCAQERACHPVGAGYQRKRGSSTGDREMSCDLSSVDGARAILEALRLDTDWDKLESQMLPPNYEGILALDKVRGLSVSRGAAMTGDARTVDGVCDDSDQSSKVQVVPDQRPWSLSSQRQPSLPDAHALALALSLRDNGPASAAAVVVAASSAATPLWPSCPSGPSSPNFAAASTTPQSSLPPGRVLSGFSDINYSSCSFSFDEHDQAINNNNNVEPPDFAKVDCSPTLPLVPLALPPPPPRCDDGATSILPRPPSRSEAKGQLPVHAQSTHADEDSSSRFVDESVISGNHENKHHHHLDPRAQPCCQSASSTPLPPSPLVPSTSAIDKDGTPSNDDPRPLRVPAPQSLETIETIEVETSTRQKTTGTAPPSAPLASPVSIYSNRSLNPPSPRTGTGADSMPFIVSNASEDWDPGEFPPARIMPETCVSPVYDAKTRSRAVSHCDRRFSMRMLTDRTRLAFVFQPFPVVHPPVPPEDSSWTPNQHPVHPVTRDSSFRHHRDPVRTSAHLSSPVVYQPERPLQLSTRVEIHRPFRLERFIHLLLRRLSSTRKGLLSPHGRETRHLYSVRRGQF